MPEFWKPSVATDVLAFAVDPEGDIRLLLIERGFEPFKGSWAFPGGFLSKDDTDLEHCACRELSEETGAKVDPHMIELLTVRSAKDRDPRQNRVISVSYMFVVNGPVPAVKGADDARHAEWRRIRDIDPTELAFDHAEIYKAALVRLMDSSRDTLATIHPVTVKDQLSDQDETFRRDVGALHY